jgi:hypothetical protein
MQFPCPTCREQLSAPDNAAGQKVACPHCGQKLQLPDLAKAAASNKTVFVSLETVPQMEVIPSSAVSVVPSARPCAGPSPAPPSPASGACPWWKTRAGVGLLCGGGMLALVLLLLVLILILAREPWHDATQGPVWRNGLGVSVRAWSLPPPDDLRLAVEIELENRGQRPHLISFCQFAQARLYDDDNVPLPMVTVHRIDRTGLNLLGPGQKTRADVWVFHAPWHWCQDVYLELEGGSLGNVRFRIPRRAWGRP